MVMKLDDVVAQVLALPAEDRAKIVARVQASLAEQGRNATVAARARPITLERAAGLLKTGSRPPTDEECEQMVDAERDGKYDV
jgi:hypothetical protein